MSESKHGALSCARDGKCAVWFSADLGVGMPSCDMPQNM